LQGLTFPAENVLINKWAPSDERSSITSIVFGGNLILIQKLPRFPLSFYPHEKDHTLALHSRDLVSQNFQPIKPKYYDF